MSEQPMPEAIKEEIFKQQIKPATEVRQVDQEAADRIASNPMDDLQNYMRDQNSKEDLGKFDVDPNTIKTEASENEFTYDDIDIFSKNLQQIYPGNYESIFKYTDNKEDAQKKWEEFSLGVFNENLEEIQKTRPDLLLGAKPADFPGIISLYYQKKAKARIESIQQEEQRDFLEQIDSQGPNVRIGRVGSGYGIMLEGNINNIDFNIPKLFKDKIDAAKTPLGLIELLTDFTIGIDDNKDQINP